MKKIFSMLALVILTVMLCGCFGDLLLLEDGEPADITVDYLLKRMDRATDPDKVYANVKSYYMKQILTNDNVNGSEVNVSEIYWKAPNYMKQISSRNGEVLNIIVSKDNRFWYVNPKTKKSREIKGKDALLVKTFTDIATPGLDYKKVFHSVTIDQILDPEQERTVYRLICRVKDPEIAPYVFYVDPKTWLTDRCETILYGPDGSQRLYVANSKEYEVVNKVRMPKKTLVTVDGKTETATTVEFTFNPDIPLSTFDLEKPWNH
ncbi:MAG: hypothetical protein E7040_11385 [Lentisphaerae bacterium]|nr:hypothetical protein [Lentisphaerota bacterium]